MAERITCMENIVRLDGGHTKQTGSATPDHSHHRRLEEKRESGIPTHLYITVCTAPPSNQGARRVGLVPCSGLEGNDLRLHMAGKEGRIWNDRRVSYTETVVEGVSKTAGVMSLWHQQVFSLSVIAASWASCVKNRWEGEPPDYATQLRSERRVSHVCLTQTVCPL